MYKWLLVVLVIVGLPFRSFGLEISPDVKIDRVEVKKSARRMYLMDGDTVIREYRIALGKNPRGHKIQEGDNRTPEGKYYLDFVMDDSAFYRSMHISYPNLRDKNRAKSLGVAPGGNIKIHGLKNDNTKPPQFVQSFDWTNGCIAITNDEMDELVSLVKIGTPIYIRW
ncbi:L,D-transpeptidase family protein [Vibrio mediterranei]|uniref:L,D-transpeptidase family protein n=1 Tax=Vibrio mediterranei TaxID=689 RepID=UPI001E622962|nr:L,D-transpeptidase family protein [Vibrio mediterranei]